VILYQRHIFFLCENVSFPKKRHLREVLLYFISVKKSAVKLQRLLVEAYGEAALSETMCRDFKSSDSDMEDKEHARRPKLVESAELEALLDKDPYQMQEQVAESLEVTRSTIYMSLKALGTFKSKDIHIL